MFWNILDEKEFLDNSHHIGLDFPQGLPRHTFSQNHCFGPKQPRKKDYLMFYIEKKPKIINIDFT